MAVRSAAVVSPVRTAAVIGGSAHPPATARAATYIAGCLFAADPLEAAVANKAFGFEVVPEKRHRRASC